MSEQDGAPRVNPGDQIVILDLDGESLKVFPATVVEGRLSAGGRSLVSDYMETWARLEEIELFRVAVGLGHKPSV